jgi:hypothetical protein
LWRCGGRGKNTQPKRQGQQQIPFGDDNKKDEGNNKKDEGNNKKDKGKLAGFLWGPLFSGGDCVGGSGGFFG